MVCEPKTRALIRTEMARAAEGHMWTGTCLRGVCLAGAQPLRGPCDGQMCALQVTHCLWASMTVSGPSCHAHLPSPTRRPSSPPLSTPVSSRGK